MRLFLSVVCVMIAMGLVGCDVSKPYVMSVPRSDQCVVGNRGFLKGTPPAAEDKTGRRREFLAIDIDIPNMPVNEKVNSKNIEPGQAPAPVMAAKHAVEKEEKDIK